MTSFQVMDCVLLVRMSGLPPAINLRELRDRIATASEDVLYHHFCETPLRHTFDNPDYRNDFAIWAKLYLGDRVLAERLGIIDPYAVETSEELRAAVLDLIDERLSETATLAIVPPGDAFYFQEATTIVFDTGDRIDHPRDLAGAIQTMTGNSIYFHFLEARRRPPVRVDDFSAWLAEWGEEYAPWIRALASIDFFFHSLAHLRADLLRALAAVEGAG